MTVNWTPSTKSSNSTANVLSKSSVSLGRYAKAGSGWMYDQQGITYDGAIDPVTGLPIYYDGEGTLPTWTPLAKS